MNPPTPPLHIAIIGAGIGGLALAIGLSLPPKTQPPSTSITYTIYEAAADYSAVGAGVVFAPNALRAMALLSPAFRDAYEAIATGNGSAEKANVFHDMLCVEPGFGIERCGMKDDPGGLPVAYEGYRKSSAHRGDLVQVMRKFVPRGNVVFGKRVVGVTQQFDGHAAAAVVITFADGEVVEADAVIGCDGGKGTVRAAVLGHDHPEEVAATYSGRYVYRTIVPMDEAVRVLGVEYARDGKMFMGPGMYITTYPMSEATQLNVLAARQTDRPWTQSHWTQDVTRAEMLADFDEEEGVVDERLLRLLHGAKPVRWALHHHLHTPTYFCRRICLLGDAAHASTPHQGAGAGQCLEDAVVLSGLLRRLVDRPDRRAEMIACAFRAYDGVVRPRAQRMASTSDEAGRMYCFTDPECGADIHKIAANANQRFHWIWEHDLEADIKRAEEVFNRLILEQQSS